MNVAYRIHVPSLGDGAGAPDGPSDSAAPVEELFDLIRRLGIAETQVKVWALSEFGPTLQGPAVASGDEMTMSLAVALGFLRNGYISLREPMSDELAAARKRFLSTADLLRR